MAPLPMGKRPGVEAASGPLKEPLISVQPNGSVRRSSPVIPELHRGLWAGLPEPQLQHAAETVGGGFAAPCATALQMAGHLSNSLEHLLRVLF